MSRRGDQHRLIRWLWTSPRPDARLMRLVLLPASGLWRTAMWLREAGYHHGWLKVHSLPLPSVAIGNLSVGGSGKTPLAGWVATHYVELGLRPGILLRGVGGDEVLEHRETVPMAIVVPDADRVAAAARAVAQGAEVLVLDDAYQRLNTARDLNLCLMSAEASQAVRWLLPAGPWREGLSALSRADGLIITRKRADLETAQALASRLRHWFNGPVAIVKLSPGHLRGLVSGQEAPVETLRGKRVIAACAIADPEAFARQLKQTGALVQIESWKDHHAFDDDDIAWLVHAVDRSDFLVMTAKDAVKVRSRWPKSVREPLVAHLDITFDSGEAELCEALDRVVKHTGVTHITR